jgi:hypothetical protein
MFGRIEQHLAHSLKEHLLKLIVQHGHLIDLGHTNESMALLQLLRDRPERGFEAAR